jgi:predicted DCC family thiol-disulfide oxidoreductase YuxK
MDWITENSDQGTFEMLTCQSEEVSERFPFIDETECMQAMQLILADGSVLPGDEALPEIFKRMNTFSSAAHLFNLPGARLFSKKFYRWFADHRYEIAKRLFAQKNNRP